MVVEVVVVVLVCLGPDCSVVGTREGVMRTAATVDRPALPSVRVRMEFPCNRLQVSLLFIIIQSQKLRGPNSQQRINLSSRVKIFFLYKY